MPLCGPLSWVKVPAPNSPPHRGGHSSPQEQSFSVWPHAASHCSFQTGRENKAPPSSGRRAGEVVGTGGEMAGRLLAEAMSIPGRG